MANLLAVQHRAFMEISCSAAAIPDGFSVLGLAPISSLHWLQAPSCPGDANGDGLSEDVTELVWWIACLG